MITVSQKSRMEALLNKYIKNDEDAEGAMLELERIVNERSAPDLPYRSNDTAMWIIGMIVALFNLIIGIIM